MKGQSYVYEKIIHLYKYKLLHFKALFLMINQLPHMIVRIISNYTKRHLF